MPDATIMKLFSVSEANDLLLQVQPVIARLQKLHRALRGQRQAVKKASESATQGGGGIPGGAQYIAQLMEFNEYSAQMEELGVQIKDYVRGLIDFPSLREGRVVLLCWQLGEGERIAWWHDIEAGFAGRQPL